MSLAMALLDVIADNPAALAKLRDLVGVPSAVVPRAVE